MNSIPNRIAIRIDLFVIKRTQSNMISEKETTFFTIRCHIQDQANDKFFNVACIFMKKKPKQNKTKKRII